MKPIATEKTQIITGLGNYYLSEQILKAIRVFFTRRDFHEVVIPVLSETLPLEPTVYPFTTSWQTAGKHSFYLSTSPEAGLKKMLARGIGNCFAFGNSFRNLEGLSRQHNPEFLMLEWYRETAGTEKIRQDIHELILYLKHKTDHYLNRKESSDLMYRGECIHLDGTWPVRSLIDLWKRYAGTDLKECLDDAVMEKTAVSKGYRIENANWEQLFNQIFLNEIEPKLGTDPCFITDFPSRISPLCAINPSEHRFADRFEVYIAGMELGNGNRENTDVRSVKNIFSLEADIRRKNGKLVPPIDTGFLDALAAMSKTSYAGVGLGVDRLIMLFSDSTDIRQTGLFAK